MSSLAGVVYKSNKRPLEKEVQNLLTSLSYWNPDSNFSCYEKELQLHNFFMHTTQESIAESHECYYSEYQCIIIADCRLDYRKELVERLDEKWEAYKNLPDNYLILKAYLKWGRECINYIYGDFTFAIWDGNKKELFCARDHFGIRPFYYCDTSDYFIFASDLQAIISFPSVRFRVNECSLIDSICTIIPDKSKTIYNNINRLEPAHLLIYKVPSSFSIELYWRLSASKRYSCLSEKQAIEGLRIRFIKAVKSRARTNHPIGLELSCGLDSSSIASTLSLSQFGPPTAIVALTHSISNTQNIRPFGHEDFSKFCDELISKSSIEYQINVTGKNENGGFDTLINFLQVQMKPVIQTYAMMSDLLYKEAHANGIRILFSGFGGDEGVTNSGAGYLRELANRKEWQKYKVELKSRIKETNGRFHYTLMIQYLRIYMPIFYRILEKLLYIRRTLKKRSKIFAVNKKLGRKHKINMRIQRLSKVSSFASLRKRQYSLLMQNHISDRLENSNCAAREHQIEYRYPFLDVKLIEFYYSLQPEYKCHSGLGRYIFRMAMKGILPESIRLHQSKANFTVPNVMHRLIQDEERFREVIRNGKIRNKYHYVNYQKLEWMLDEMKIEEQRRKLMFTPHMFLTPISILILQKWQREGKIDIGIKC